MHGFCRNATAAFACLVIAACDNMTAKPNALEPLHVEVSNVLAGGGGGREPTYPVVIARDREARLSARVGGVLNVFPVRIGDRRPRGALIGKIEATSYDAATTRALTCRS